MKITMAAVVTIVVLAGAAYLFVGPRANESTVPSQHEDQLAALKQELSRADAERAELQTTLAAAEARNRELEAAVEETKQPAPAATVETEKPAEPDATKDDERRKQSLDEIREAIRANAGAEAQVKALTELMYADFLNSLDLDPEAKAELRRLLTESLLESLSLRQFAITEGDIPWSEVRGWELDERAYLDAKLKELLPKEAYAEWTNYFQDIDEHQLEGNLRNQIRAVASGLTPENFELALQVAVEEFRAQQFVLEQSHQPFTGAENIYYQLRAMEAMRARLTTLLPPDQLAEIENWLTMADRLLTAQLPQDAKPN